MTKKELLYVEDALGHEEFMKTSCCETSKEITDINLSNYIKELETTHSSLYQKFFNLL